MNSKNLVLWVSFLIGLPLLAYILQTTDFTRVFAVITQVQLDHLIVYFALACFNLVAYSVVWHVFLQSHDVSIPPITLFNYRMAGFAISYVTPGPRIGGEITQGNLVGANSSTKTRTGILTSAMEKFTLFLGGLLFDSAVVLLAFIILPESTLLRFVLIGLAGVTGVLAVLWYGFIFKNGAKRLMNWLASWVDVAKYSEIADDVTDRIQAYVLNETKPFILVVAIAVLTKFVIAGQIYVLTAALNTPVSIMQAIFLAAAIDIAYSIPSYMGVGVLEAGQSGVFRLFGGAQSSGVLVALITRLRDIIFSVYGLLALVYYTHTNIYQSFKEQKSSQ